MLPLKILKASAGSGKTFRLTHEYLKLVLKDALAYKHILAVTFTKKATEEMKNRITKELFILSSGKESQHIELLCKELKFNETHLRTQAKIALQKILNDYSRFNIDTIDSFFQRIIRSFLQEIGLDPGYEIELNQRKILEEVTADILSKLHENKELQEWMIDIAEENISEGHSWDVQKALITLGKELFKESYQQISAELNIAIQSKENLKSFKSKLIIRKKQFEKTCTEYGEKGIKIIANNRYSVDDFAHGEKGVANFFNKCTTQDFENIGSRVLEGMQDAEKWASKSSPKKKELIALASTQLIPLLNEAVEYVNSQLPMIETIQNILKSFGYIGVLYDLMLKIREYTFENNSFLLSDSGDFLKRIIEGSDAPFVYEKTGVFIKNFMIDEFQDTSSNQWNNFIPLLENSLAENHQNLIVGDVKQSIYRWRSSDWKILANEVQKQFSDDQTSIEHLSDNYRSCPHIIDFNNAIFSVSSEILQDHFNKLCTQKNNTYSKLITNAYLDVEQDYPTGKEADIQGSVRIDFVNNENKDFKEKAVNKAIEYIEQLQEKGYHAREIAIIVRTGKDGKLIADALLNYKASKASKPNIQYDFISSDSIYLFNAPCIQFIVSILKYYISPENSINRNILLHHYYKLNHIENGSQNFLPNQNNSIPNEELLALLEKIYKENISKSLFEINAAITKEFNLNQNEYNISYLQAYYDLILDFSRKYSGNLKQFIDWIAEHSDATLSINESQNAIRIITIHKAKGLQFKNVIIPFCSWELESTREYMTPFIWCNTQATDLKDLPYIPIKYNKIKNTVFQQEYNTEKVQMLVDNLNLLYVAFTRCCNNLYIVTPNNPKLELKTTGDLLLQTLKRNTQNNKHEIILNANLNEDVYQLGTIETATSKEKEQKHFVDWRKIRTGNSRQTIRQKRNYDTLYSNVSNLNLLEGNYMHQVMADIQYEKDIPQAIEKLYYSGKISLQEKEIIRNKIENLISTEKARHWFSEDYEILNEKEIITPENNLYRPDRIITKNNEAIVIDYKFGDIKTKKHRKQISLYTQLLKEMGYIKVSGYLWYVQGNEIELVE